MSFFFKCDVSLVSHTEVKHSRHIVESNWLTSVDSFLFYMLERVKITMHDSDKPIIEFVRFFLSISEIQIFFDWKNS